MRRRRDDPLIPDPTVEDYIRTAWVPAVIIVGGLGGGMLLSFIENPRVAVVVGAVYVAALTAGFVIGVVRQFR